MRRGVLLLFCLTMLVSVSPVAACFGPKLFIAVDGGVEGDLSYAVVSLYLKEKTGVEAQRVDLAGKDGLLELAADRADLVVIAAAPDSVAQLAPGLVVASGKRPRDDLQFTTVLPALKKLDTVMRGAPWPALLQRVRAGEGALAVARSLFKMRGAL